jgi:Na+/proline symporter
LATVDWLPVLLFVAWAIFAGFRARRAASRNLEEYFLAGRGLRGWQAGISMSATQFAADTPLLVTGLIATAGVFALWRLWIYALAFLLMGFVLAPSWRRASVVTDAELSELRYSGRSAAALRGIKAVYFGLIFNCTVLAMVLWAAREIVEPFLLWNEWLPAGVFGFAQQIVTAVGVPVAREVAGGGDLWLRSTNNMLSIGAIVIVTTLYSAAGGLRGVVRTDIVQFAIMMVATLVYAVIVVDAVGGLGALGDRLAAQYGAGGPGGITPPEILAFTPSRARDAGGFVLAVIALQWLVQMNADGTGYLAQRSMACRSDRDAMQAAVVFSVAQIVVRSLLWLPLGVGLLVLFPPDPGLAAGALVADREATFVRGIVELLPPGVLGLMLTAMLAALASTLDTHLNWGSSYLTNDLYRRFVCRAWLGREPSERGLVWVARGANLVILALALAIMTQLSSIQVAWQVSLLLGAGMGVMLVLRWLWWRANANGELAAIVASGLLAPLLLWALPGEQEALRLLAMALGSTAVGVVVTLVTAPEPRERLEAFFARARPPGFWAPVAGNRATEAVARLRNGLAATALAAFSLFCLLAGVGSWMLGSPAPTWLPHAGLWIALLLTVGAGLVPVWWRLAFARVSASD